MTKQIRLVIILFLCCIAQGSVWAKKYYWVGGTGNWSQYTTHWASTSGGAPGAPGIVQVPTSSDTVYFNAASFTGNAQVVTVDVAAVCNSMDWTGSTTLYTGATNGPRMAFSQHIDIFGDLTLASGMKGFNIVYPYFVRFKSTSGTRTITTNGVPIGTQSIGSTGIEFSSPTGTWVLGDALTVTGPVNFISGTFNTNGQNFTCGLFQSGSGLSRTLNLGSSYVQVVGVTTSDGNYWNVYENTNLTVNAGTSTIHIIPATGSFTGTSVVFKGGHNQTYYRVVSDAPNSLIQATTTGNNITIARLIIKQNGYLNYTVNVLDTVFFNGGKDYKINGVLALGAATKFIVASDCRRISSITSTSLFSVVTISKTGGWATTTLSYVRIGRINATGGGTLVCNNSFDDAGNLNITVNTPAAQTFYWIGGTGNWSDGNHWSLTSGGAASGCAPSQIDDAVFDVNSFSGAGEQVIIDTVVAYCNNMTWTAGVVGSPILKTGTGLLPSITFNIYGSLTYTAAMSTAVICPVYFRTTGTSNITSASQQFDYFVYFSGTGTYNIMDAFVHRGNGASTPPYIQLERGTLNSNGNSMTLRGFQATSIGGTTKIFNMSSSLITINRIMGSAGYWNWYSTTAGNGVTINAETSKIYLRNAAANLSCNFYGGNQTFNVIEFQNPEIDPNAYEFTADSVIFLGGLNFDNNAIGGPTMTVNGYLKLSPSKTYLLESAGTINLGASAIVDAVGNCSGLISIRASSTTPATFSKPSGAVTVEYCVFENNTASGGATFTANNSISLGGVTGWTVNTVASRDLYWVGGTGNWSDQSHWSLTSGGAGGECIPNQTDDVYFNANSFSGAGQSVTLDLSVNYCRSMYWIGVTNTPTLTGVITNDLKMYGSLTLASAMTVSFPGGFYFLGSGTITSNGKTISGNPYFDSGAGTYSFADAFRIAGYFYFYSGTINTNNYTCTVPYFYLHVGTATRTFNFGTSSVYCGGYYYGSSTPTGSSRGLTVNASNASFYMSHTLALFYGLAFTYGRVESTAPTGTMSIGRNGTYKKLIFKGNGSVYGNVTVTDSIYLKPSKVYSFEASQTTFFSDTCDLAIVGSGASVVSVNSLSSGTQFTWSKPSGRICADYIYIRDNNATGGATWQGGANADDQGNVTGWDFSPYPVLGTATLSGGGVMCPTAGRVLTYTFSQNFYPKILVIRKQDGGGATIGYDTITVTSGMVSAGTYTMTVTPTATTTYSLFSCLVDRCYGGTETVSGSAAIFVPTGISGLWEGATSNDWFNCVNWDDGIVPTSAISATIPSAVSNMPVIGAAGAVCKNLTINNSASLNITNALSTLDVYGSMYNDGNLSASLGTISMVGNSVDTVGGSSSTTLNHLIINNNNGILLNNNLTVGGTLTLTSGNLNIRNRTLTLGGTIAASGTGKLNGINTSSLTLTGTGTLGTNLIFETGGQMLANLTMNGSDNTRTAVLGTPLTLYTQGNFVNGILTTTSVNYLEFYDNAITTNASDNSFVSGPVIKTGNDAFTFPIGKNGEYHYCGISAPAGVGEQFVAEYFDVDAVTAGVASATPLAGTLNHISTCDYWDIDRIGAGTGVLVTLSWSMSSCGVWSGVTSPANLVVAHWYSTTPIWEDLGASTYSGNNAAGYVTASLSSSSYSPFVLASRTGANPLPVELLSFTAKKNKDVVDLKWVTAAEINNDYFTLERSSDTKTFTPFAEVNGAGNSAIEHSYTTVDYFPMKGISYYRLKQTDYDGKYTYSQIVPVDFNDSKTFEIGIYPNPGNGRNINVSLNGVDGRVLVVLRDVLGKECYSKVITDDAGDVQFVLESTEPLAKGVYIISASSDDKLISKKLVVE